ncbi:MAG: hypothetical protein ACXU82_00310 [Caulobacteraceae bacterium]
MTAVTPVWRRRLRLIGLATCSVALGLAAAASAEAAEGPNQSRSAHHPDLSGFWRLDEKIAPDPTLMKRIGANAVVLHDTGAPELPRGDYGGLKLTPAAIAAAQAWDPKEDLSVAKVCSPPSIIYAMQGPFPMEVYQGTELIIFKLEYYDIVRVIFMDGRGHPPKDAPHSKTGHSIGRWDGDVLVVDTDHLEASTLTNNGLNHTEDVHVIERFRLSPDGKTLLSTQEFEDPAVLDNRGARFIAWTKQPGNYVNPYDCDPSFALNYSAPDPSK